MSQLSQRNKKRSQGIKNRHRMHVRNRQMRKGMLIGAGALCLLAVIGICKAVSAVHSSREAARLAEARKLPPATATILSTGDILPHGPIIESPLYYNQADGTYNFDAIFTYMKPDFEAADFAVANLETSLAESGFSGHPLFRSPPALSSALKASGIDMCLLANNHIYDGFDAGLASTMSILEQQSLSYTGVRKTASDPRYFVQDVNGIKIGILNYVYETDPIEGQKSINVIPVSAQSAALINSFNYDNLEAFYTEIQTCLDAMKEQKVEYTIAYLHWGNEYQITESETQRAIAQRLCDMGVNALIGAHPHVVQPADLLSSSSGEHQMVCVYSLGNTISNQREERMGTAGAYPEDGLTVTLTISRDEDGNVTLEDAGFIPTWVYHRETNGNEFYVLPLTETDKLPGLTGLENLSPDITDSLARTKEIISAGEAKIKDALPLP